MWTIIRSTTRCRRSTCFHCQLRPDLPLPRNFLIALDTLALKSLTAPPATLACRAEELLLWWTLEFAREMAHHKKEWSDAIETEYKDFVNRIFYDTDFLFLYNPKADGIEKLKELGVKSLSVDHWFLPFNRHHTVNPPGKILNIQPEHNPC